MAANHHTPAPRQTIDLTRLSLSSGEGRKLELPIELGALEFGGAPYRFGDGRTTARVDVSRTAAGYALKLRFAGELHGQCMRCLEPASIPVEVEAREVDQPSSRDEELLSPYVTEGELDLSGWARDALALELPQQLLCRPDCAGLCPVCGESLNDAEPGAHEHPREPDPRWAKLRELG